MTRTELTSAVRRHNRYRVWLVNLALVALFGFPSLGIYVTTRPGYSPERYGGLVVALDICALVIPICALGLTWLVLRRYGVRCPHCQAFAGLEKPRVYDVTVTGRCRQCGKILLDDMA